MRKKKSSNLKLRWVWKKLRIWLKENCTDIDTYRLGDMKYCLEKYFLTIGRKKPNKKSSVILFSEYYNKDSPIFKGIKAPGLTLKREGKKERTNKYEAYIKSEKWKTFKAGIIKARGTVCEKCKSKHKSLDLHHKTYARLFNELPQDVMLLCRQCHNKVHGKKQREFNDVNIEDEVPAYEYVNSIDPINFLKAMYNE